jgi:hypothetical protein
MFGVDQELDVLLLLRMKVRNVMKDRILQLDDIATGCG